jgi:hypothetical protein
MHYYCSKTEASFPVELAKSIVPVRFGCFQIELKGGLVLESAVLIDETIVPNVNQNLFLITTEDLPDEHDFYTERILEFPIIAWRISRMPGNNIRTIPIIANTRLSAEIENPRILDKSTEQITDIDGENSEPECYGAFQANISNMNLLRQAAHVSRYRPWTEDDWMAGRCVVTDIGKASTVLKSSETTTG